MTPKRILTVFLAACTVLSASAQDFVYLFPSKEIAETGEDLFFKAYLMDRETMALSRRSQTLYLEIRTERDSLAIMSTGAWYAIANGQKKESRAF